MAEDGDRGSIEIDESVEIRCGGEESDPVTLVGSNIFGEERIVVLKGRRIGCGLTKVWCSRWRLITMARLRRAKIK